MFFYNPSRLDGFFEIGYGLGLDFADDGRAVVPLDIDGDGDLDVATLGLQGLRLMENRLPREGRHFSRIRLRATRSQHHALVANVTIETGGVRQQDYVHATAGFQTQVPLDLHFGLGKATKIDRLEIRWPSGAIEAHRDLPVDRLLSITEGRPPAVLALPAWPAGRPRPPTTFGQMTAVNRGRPSVVRFEAPDCKACEADRQVLRALQAEFGARVSFSVAGGGVSSPPATLVFDAKGSLRRALYRAVTREDLAPILESLLDERPVASYLAALAWDEALRGDYAKARDSYGKALAAEPGNTLAAIGLASVAYQDGATGECIEILTKVTRRDPWQRRAWEVLALCQAVDGAKQDALSSCRHATQLSAASTCVKRVAAVLDGGTTPPK